MSTAAPQPTRRQEAGAAARAETRRRLLSAAQDVFNEHGYTAATVAKIAARAGVTVQTLYLNCQSKRELLRACMEAQLAGDDTTPYAQARPAMIAATRANGDPAEIIGQIALLYRQIAERAALGWRLYRDAAVTDPEIAADWALLQALRHETFAALIAQLPARSLRRTLTRAAATDTAWAIASPDTHDLLVRTRGYTLDQYQDWVHSALIALLLDPATVGSAKTARGRSER